MSAVQDVLKRAVAYVKDLYKREPTRVNTAVVAVLAAVGLPAVISGVAVGPVVAAVLLILLGGEATRSVAYAPATVEKLVKQAKRKRP